jgi:DNA-directed RNA polymerase subunit beta|uniref:DNA-directed RNA polymerase subunit beta n=1 Tax=Cyanidiaceae sp. MX-AZ01 TaxID=1503164 RepID=A0A060A8Y7_9RHOD|nr:RNA polymerase beta subunit [Cyanidiaceae sp. MX-AZ01]
MTDLIAVQRNSYYSFLTQGLKEEFDYISPIVDYTGQLELRFLTSDFEFKPPKLTVSQAKKQDATYSLGMYMPVQLWNHQTGDIKQQTIYFGEMPLMTEDATFIINGAERVVVNQIVRSPGVYFKSLWDKNHVRTFEATFMANRGAWIKYELDKQKFLWVRLDKNRKMPLVVFLQALGLTEQEIWPYLTDGDLFHHSWQAHAFKSCDAALLEFYKKMRPGEPATINSAKQLLYARFFDARKYDLSEVGRYKLNKKFQLDIPTSVRILTTADLLAGLDYLLQLSHERAKVDDIDHLANRRLKCVGELLQNQVRIGLSRLEKLLKEKMTIGEKLQPSNLLNPKPLTSSLREFFASSQLSQFMDQINPLAELTHKRRLSALGPGGLTRERAGFAVRDIHPSHYGRICPIETPEGPNAGLIGSLAIFARVNRFGFIETPYYVVKNAQVQKQIVYLTADVEDEYRLAPADVKYNSEGKILQSTVAVRFRQEWTTCDASQVDYMGISPIQFISAATCLIPFLEHDDANRALMGSNMQRQAVPLVKASKPLVTTGQERWMMQGIFSKADGIVRSVQANRIRIQHAFGTVDYALMKYQKSNQDTCIDYRALVWVGEYVQKGQLIAQSAAMDGGELALGQNVLIAYMPWEGYNFEDAFVISERLVYEDLYTSIHIEKYETDARQTKLGAEEITRKIPNVGEHALRQLDEQGIISVGSWVEAGSILVGKITPKGESDQPPEGKLLRAIFGEKNKHVKDSSLRMPNGARGRVVHVRILSRDKGDELAAGVNLSVRVSVAVKRAIQVGDKMAGRHGNKGIVARILPRCDMPYLPDGTPVDVILNPLGVPSRMNVGQLFEALLGLAAYHLRKRIKIVPFDEMYHKEASRIFVHQQLKRAKLKDQTILYDGRSGERFDNPVTVGIAYMLKLVHLVDEKIHARSTGPYSLVTQQPLGGRAQHGGQRLGEMEVWALEAYGAAYTLQELLTLKSDDMEGRTAALNAIVKAQPIPKGGTPESFKVLMRELQALGLDVTVLELESKSLCVMQSKLD